MANPLTGPLTRLCPSGVGPDRARMLGDLRVQLADAAPGEDHGYIPLVTVPPWDKMEVARVERKRLYG